MTSCIPMCTFQLMPKGVTYHGHEVHAQYLAGTRDEGIWMRPSRKRFECYVDAPHVEDWEHQPAMQDPLMALS